MTQTEENSHPYDWAASGPPLGVWQTHEGTLSTMMGSVLTINSDGTGLLKDHSVLRGEQSWKLLWRQVGHGHTQILQFWDDDNNETDTEDSWDDVRYSADWVDSDVNARVPVLLDTGLNSF